MSVVYTYASGNQFANQSNLVKDSTEKPSVFIDFTDGVISSSITVNTITAVAVSSTNASITANVVGTIGASGSIARVDLKTCGAGGTSAALDGDRMKMTVTATLSSGGPLLYDCFIDISAPTYGPV